MVKVNAKLKTSLFIVLLLLLSIYLIKYTRINVGAFVDNSFLFTYLGIFLGFAITIFTFIVSMIEKVRERIENDQSKTDAEKKIVEDDVIHLYKEIKQNIMLIFYSFLLVIIITLFGTVDIPFIKIPDYLGVSKNDLFSAIKLEILLLSLYSIYDLAISSFTISNLTGIIKKEKGAS